MLASLRSPGPVLAILAILSAPALAHADASTDPDADCSDDPAPADGGTFATRLADAMATCDASGTCNTDDPPARGPTGAFHAETVTLGLEGQTDDGSGVAAGWVTGEAGARGGWHRGIQGCVHGRLAAGATTHVQSSWSVVFPFWFTGIGLAFDQAYDLRPALSTSRVWLRRDYTYDRMHAAMAVTSWRSGDGSTGAVIPVEVTTGWREQPDGTRARAAQQTVTMSLFEHEGASHVTVLRFEDQLLYPDGIPPDGVAPAAVGKRPAIEVGRFDPLDLDLRLGDHLRGEASAGWAWSSLPLRCEACAGYVGAVGVTGRAAGGTWHVRSERSAALAVDARVVVEDRVTLAYAHPHRHGDYRIGAWSALTRTTAADETHVVATGGGEASVDWRLAERLLLSVDAEAGRSYYARLDGDPAPVAEPGARLGIRLEQRFGHR